MAVHRQNSGGGGYVPPTFVHCAACWMYRRIDEFVLEDGVNSGTYGKLVCPECYDGPEPDPPVIGPDNLGPTEQP